MDISLISLTQARLRPASFAGWAVEARCGDGVEVRWRSTGGDWTCAGCQQISAFSLFLSLTFLPTTRISSGLLLLGINFPVNLSLPERRRSTTHLPPIALPNGDYTA